MLDTHITMESKGSEGLNFEIFNSTIINFQSMTKLSIIKKILKS